MTGYAGTAQSSTGGVQTGHQEKNIYDEADQTLEQASQGDA